MSIWEQRTADWTTQMLFQVYRMSSFHFSQQNWWTHFLSFLITHSLLRCILRWQSVVQNITARWRAMHSFQGWCFQQIAVQLHLYIMYLIQHLITLGLGGVVFFFFLQPGEAVVGADRLRVSTWFSIPDLTSLILRGGEERSRLIYLKFSLEKYFEYQFLLALHQSLPAASPATKINGLHLGVKTVYRGLFFTCDGMIFWAMLSWSFWHWHCCSPWALHLSFFWTWTPLLLSLQVVGHVC